MQMKTKNKIFFEYVITIIYILLLVQTIDWIVFDKSILHFLQRNQSPFYTSYLQIQNFLIKIYKFLGLLILTHIGYAYIRKKSDDFKISGIKWIVFEIFVVLIFVVVFVIFSINIFKK